MSAPEQTSDWSLWMIVQWLANRSLSTEGSRDPALTAEILDVAIRRSREAVASHPRTIR